MKRTPSDAAKVMGVNVALVKSWALTFRDYLSPAANPPKGKERQFTDTDMLVLSKVGLDWEHDPDIGTIKVGLNQGNHFETRFVEHLYLHTPLLQELPDDLDETWRHGILLCGGGRNGYLELARSYRHVAESMLQTALERNDVDEWAFPVLFAYRHALELHLKLIGEIDEITHSLRRCVDLVERRRRVRLPPPIRGWILELEEIDPAGTAFRYADEDDGANRRVEHWFDFQHFQFAMKQVFDALDMATLRAGAKGKPAKKTK